MFATCFVIGASFPIQGMASGAETMFLKTNINLREVRRTMVQNDNIDMSKPIWLVTNTGKHFLVMDVQMMANIDSKGIFEVITTKGNAPGVTSVSFFRCEEKDLPTGIEDAETTTNDGQLQLMTPVNSCLTLSGCGNATEAIVFAANGSQVCQASVVDGTVTVQVAHLPQGVYIVKVGNKALKFTKK